MKRWIWLFLLLCLCVSCLRPADAQSGYAWVQSIGRPGAGAALFSTLTGVAVDASGNMYVSDAGRNTVDVLDSKGNFLFAFGSYSPFGAAPGTFYSPDKIVRDSAGNFYVADYYNSRIEKFDAKGRFLTQFGTYGSRTGQFYYPEGVTLDSAGNIYVADSYNNRIQKFSAKGVPLLKFGASGTINGLLNTPVAVAVDGTGNIYVADQGNNRIQKFNSAGSYLLKFGTSGSGNGQFNSLNDVAVDSSGNIYVADSSNNRIQKFNIAGTFISSLAVSSVAALSFDSAGNLYAVGGANIAVINPANMQIKYNFGSAMTPNYLAVDGSGNSYVTDTNGRLLKFDPTGKVLQSLSIPAGAEGVAVDSTGNIYISDYSNTQVLKYPAGGGAPTTVAPYGAGNGQVSYPWGLALDSAGNLYVADTSNHRIEIFSKTGAFVAAYGAYGTGNGQFYYPRGVAVDSTGNIYVADTYNHRIQKLSAAGKYLLQFGTKGTGNGQFNYPSGVAVDSTGNIYVADTNNNRIQKFNASGSFLSPVFPTPLSSPQGLQFDNAGNLLATDTGNGRIDRFSPGGQLLGGYDAFGSNYATFSHPLGVRIDSSNNLYVTSSSWAEKVSTSGNWLGNFGSFSGAAGLTLDSSGNIYIVDRGGTSVQKFNSSLVNVGGFGSSGSSNGQFSSPTGIALDSKGNLYITDPGNTRVQKFNSTFAYVSQFGTSGTGDGQFMTPSGIAVTSANNLLVADYSASASWVNLFGLGTGFPYMGSFGYYGAAYGQFNNPFDVNLDSVGNIYVADQGNSRVQIFDPNANFLYSIGTAGGGNGQLIYPDSVAVDSNGVLYIADSYTNRLSVFAPIPILTAASPLTAPAGSAALTLTATGSGFTPDAAIAFNGVPLTTIFTSNSSLSATLPATQIATLGTYPVTIMQAGGTSNPLTFTVTNGTIPTITTINPTSTTAGISSLALTVTGSNFQPGAVIFFGTSGLPTPLGTSTQLTTTVPGSLLTAAGTVPVTVVQPGGTSAPVTFTINPSGPPPAITGISPASVDQGSPTVTLTLNGTGFTSDAVVKFNTTALVTTFVSATQLTAILPASFLTAMGSFPVVVSQSSGTSAPVGFSVNAPAPVVTGLSPLNARVGSPAITLSVTGTGFTSDAVVNFNTTALTTTFVSATQVTAAVPASLLTAVGVYQVVLTEASGSSDPVGFLVNAAPPSVSGLSPTAVLKGSAAINLTVTGTGFTSDAVITFGGTALTTTFTSATQLTATVPATMLTTSGFYPVLVKQKSGISRKVLFIVL